jgi:hypothetical protein
MAVQYCLQLPPVLDTPYALDAYVGAAINTKFAMTDTVGGSGIPSDALDDNDRSRTGKVQRRFLRYSNFFCHQWYPSFLSL